MRENADVTEEFSEVDWDSRLLRCFLFEIGETASLPWVDLYSVQNTQSTATSTPSRAPRSACSRKSNWKFTSKTYPSSFILWIGLWLNCKGLMMYISTIQSSNYSSNNIFRTEENWSLTPIIIINDKILKQTDRYRAEPIIVKYIV